MGIENLKELLDVPLTLVDMHKRAMADGKIGFEDAGLILLLIPKLGPAIDKVGEVPKELADLSVEEGAEVVSFVMAKLVVEEPKAREIIDASLKLLVAGVSLVRAIKQ